MPLAANVGCTLKGSLLKCFSAAEVDLVIHCASYRAETRGHACLNICANVFRYQHAPMRIQEVFNQSCPTRFQNLGTNHNRMRHSHSMSDLDCSSCRLGKQCRSPHMSWTPAQFNCKAVIHKIGAGTQHTENCCINYYVPQAGKQLLLRC